MASGLRVGSGAILCCVQLVLTVILGGFPQCGRISQLHLGVAVGTVPHSTGNCLQLVVSLSSMDMQPRIVLVVEACVACHPAVSLASICYCR